MGYPAAVCNSDHVYSDRVHFATHATMPRPPLGPALHTVQRTHRRHPHPPPSWWASPTGLSLTAFPFEPAAAAPYARSAGPSGQFQFHLPQLHRQPAASSSRSVFGANNANTAYNYPILAPPSPASSSSTTPSPGPAHVHVVCTAPLVAPKPLPYHSPTFLQFDLPDDDEDLSHPPYVSRPHKRKRAQEDEDGEEDEEEEGRRRVIVGMKRRAVEGEGRGYLHGRWGVHGHTHGDVGYAHLQRTNPHPHLRTTLPVPVASSYVQRHR